MAPCHPLKVLARLAVAATVLLFVALAATIFMYYAGAISVAAAGMIGCTLSVTLTAVVLLYAYADMKDRETASCRFEERYGDHGSRER